MSSLSSFNETIYVIFIIDRYCKTSPTTKGMKSIKIVDKSAWERRKLILSGSDEIVQTAKRGSTDLIISTIEIQQWKENFHFKNISYNLFLKDF